MTLRHPRTGVHVGDFWDEMFEAPDRLRPHYEPLARHLARLSGDEVARASAQPSCRSKCADTFAVNQGAEGVEKIMPFDVVPRLIRADEWQHLERGPTNAFAHSTCSARHLPRAAHM